MKVVKSQYVKLRISFSRMERYLYSLGCCIWWQVTLKMSIKPSSLLASCPFKSVEGTSVRAVVIIGRWDKSSEFWA